MNRLLLALPGLCLFAACGESPTTPTPPAVGAPVLACPAAVSAQSLDGNPVAVSYSTPAVTGGAAPVTTSCLPATGSMFPVGSTSVTCTARDARQQTASCSFAVSVAKVPQLTATKFLAFGDSITEGVTSTCNRVTAGMSFFETLLVLPKGANDPWTYPNVLQGLLRERYVAQSSTVSNQGRGGEFVADGATRLPGIVASAAPQVVLLQEGANDANSHRSPSSIAGSLRTMVRDAKGRGMQVYVGTLLPQRPLGVLGSCRGYGEEDVPGINTAIRTMAGSEGVPLVDLYQAFGGVPGDFIGADGLHPSEAGYRKIAETFFDTIRQRLEK